MTIYEAIQARHSVRAYQDKPIAGETAILLKQEIDRLNAESGLHMQLVLNEPKAFQSRLARYGKFSCCSNYIVMAGTPSEKFEENVGYYGEQVVLLAQTFGLNSCWVGLTYQKVDGAFSLDAGEKVACVIALGYGVNDGVQHKGKNLQDVSNFQVGRPEWFRAGVEAALLAPTAVNQQKFRFELQSDNETVKAISGRSFACYTKMDLGIVKRHFEVAVHEYESRTGIKVCFRWA